MPEAGRLERQCTDSVQMRRSSADKHGLVALLSFSNVAVDTFRKDYSVLARSQSTVPHSLAVEIDTVDGFITSNILRPHAYRSMGAPRTAFLVQGKEPFLRNFTVYDGRRPHPTAELRVSLENGELIMRWDRLTHQLRLLREKRKRLLRGSEKLEHTRIPWVGSGPFVH